MLVRHFTQFLVFGLLFSVGSASAKAILVEKIFFEGLEKTRQEVIYGELGFKPGDTVEPGEIQQGLQRLRNTRLFSRVSSRLHQSSPGKAFLTVNVQERWTTIPIFKVSSGGGVSQTTLGVYDSNLFGRYLEAGAQITKLEDVYSGVVWFKNPRLFQKRLIWDLQLWNTSVVRTKYNQTLDEPIPITGFLHRRDQAYTALTWLFNSGWSFHLTSQLNRDLFSDDFLDPAIRDLLVSKPLPPDTEVWLNGLGVAWGQIDYRRYLEDGLQVGLDYRYGSSRTEGIRDFHQTDVSFEYRKSFLGRGTFAQRNLSGTTTTKVLQYWYYLGGLDRIRGFSNDRFAGRYYLLNNSEVRWVWFDKPKYVIQTVAFVDALSSGEEFRTLGTLSGASAGAGIRVILPKVYRFVIRLDYASPLQKEDDMNLSFGVQQFF